MDPSSDAARAEARTAPTASPRSGDAQPDDGPARLTAALLDTVLAWSGDFAGALREWRARPPDKTYARQPRVELPPAPEPRGELGALLLRRRSTRYFAATALDLARLSALLRWSAGFSDGHAGRARTYPSGGAYYPYELYVLARRVAGLEPGAYHWHAPTHALERLPPGELALEALWPLVLEPRFRPAAALVVVTGDPGPSATKYGARACRFLWLSAGAILQNLYLVAEALGLGISALGAPADQLLERFLGLRGTGERVLTYLAVGGAAPDAGPPPPWAWPAELAERDRADQEALALSLPPEALHGAAWPDSQAARAALRALHGAERVLGVRLRAELPPDLAALPREAWPAYPTIRRFAAALPVRVVAARAAPEGPALPMYAARLEPASGYGIDVRDHVRAVRAALGEALERWCWLTGVGSRRVVRAPAAALGAAALDPGSLAGYGPDLRRRDPDALAWTPATPLAWVAGESLVDGCRRLVPLQLIVASSNGLTRGEPELRPRTTNGLAAGATRAEATLRALLELVERDAFMLTWLSRQSPPRLDPAALGDPDCLELLARLERARLSPTLLQLPTDLPAHAVAAVLENRAPSGPGLVLAAAARPRLEEAVRKALLEGVQCWYEAASKLPGTDPAAIRPTTRDGRVLWWALPGRRERLAWFLDGPVRAPVFGPEPPAAPEAALARLVGWFREHGEEIVAVDVLEPVLARRLGCHVVAVVAPSLHPLHLDERRPAFWSRRLEARLAGRPPNPEPHPFP